jgi:uncharacterized protein (DUF1810 family)
MILAVVMYRTVLSRDRNEVQQAAFESVKTAMQQGLAQMHWQWQYEGRPSHIEYAVGERQKRQIEMNTEGWPVLGRSLDDCKAWLNMFAAESNVEVFGLGIDVGLERQLEMKVEFIRLEDSGSAAIANPMGDGVEINDGVPHVSKRLADTCRYSRKDQSFDYALGTGSVL